MPWDTVLIGLLWLIQPITAFIAGIVAYAALRDGLDWRGVRIAAAWIAGPWLACLVGLPMLGDSDTGAAEFVGSVPTLVAIAVAVAISIGVIYRMGTEDDTVR